MNKEKLKRLKASLLAIMFCLTLSSCKKNEETKEDTNDAAVFFIEGKALIYEEGEEILITDLYSSIGDNILKHEDKTIFSTGVEAIRTRSVEDAYELAVAIVGEENIIYIDYNGDDMQLSYNRKLK